MRKQRLIKAIYEEAEFCESCNEGMEIVPSSLALANNNQPQQMVMVWKCPKCGKSYPVTMENQPTQLFDYGDWEDITFDGTGADNTPQLII